MLASIPTSTDPIRVITARNPFEPARDCIVSDIECAGAVKLLTAAPHDPEAFYVAVNGGLVEKEDIAETWLMPGDCVVLCPRVHGGGGGKDIVRIAALITVAYFTMGAGTAAAGVFGGTTTTAGAIAGAAASVAASVAGSMLVNSLLPPPKPEAVSIGSDKMGQSASYGIDGPKNTSAEGMVVPVVYGKYRIGGNLVSCYTKNVIGYRDVEGENGKVTSTPYSTQDVYLLFAMGEGPVSNLSDFQINDQPIDSFKAGTVQVFPRMGYGQNQPIPGFDEIYNPVTVNRTITTDWTTFETTGIAERLRLDVVAPQGFCKINKSNGDLSELIVDLEVEVAKLDSDEWVPAEIVSQEQGRMKAVLVFYKNNPEDDNEPLKKGWIYETTLKDIIGADGELDTVKEIERTVFVGRAYAEERERGHH